MSESGYGHGSGVPRGFSAIKAAQLAAFLLITIGRPVTRNTLLLMLYLSERAFAERHGHLIVHDEYLALETGPTPARCSAGVAGDADRDLWSVHVAWRADLMGPRRSMSEAQLDHLSVAERTAALEAISRLSGLESVARVIAAQWAWSHLPEYR